jgi:ARG/rhodanese/phosphatase superfamily protein
MECRELIPADFDLAAYRVGLPQRSGPLTVVPLFGPDRGAEFAGPLSGLKLSRVEGYGNVELSNPGGTGLAIVPLHMGYIQDQAQNHALCRSAFIAPGQKLMFHDACCVQAAQGGYLEERDQWFFILPLELRAAALERRGEQNYAKLWEDIAALNRRYGLPRRGHLEQIVSRRRAYLSQFQSRLELLPGQTGALFLLAERLAGVEIAPTAAYFQELWMPLASFCYGVAAMFRERKRKRRETRPLPVRAGSLQEIRSELQRSREAFQEQVCHWLAETPREPLERKEEERYLDFRLYTVSGKHFTGQVVELKPAAEAAPGGLAGLLHRVGGKREEAPGTLVYASLFARPEYLEEDGR